MKISLPLLISTKPYSFLFPLWIVVCLIVFTYNLDEVPPYHTDESYYIESVQSMVESGDYLTPYYHERKRFAKPILIYWLMAATYKVFGFSPAVARLSSAVMGTFCVVLVYFLALKLFSRTTAWLSALILPGFYLHFLISRWATTDMTLNFFILAAFYFFICGYQENKYRALHFNLFYLSIALGFLTKGPPAVLLPFTTVILFLLIKRQKKMFAQMRVFSGIFIILTINLPWFVAMYLLHGDEFTNHLIRTEIYSRVFNDAPFSFYFIWVLFRYYLPWSFFLVSGLLICVLSFFRKGKDASQIRKWFHRDSCLFCLFGILIPLIIFSLLRFQHSRYMLSASPFMAMMLGYFFTKLAELEGGFWSAVFKIPFFFTLLLYAIIALGAEAAVIFFKFEQVPFCIYYLPKFLIFGVTVLVCLYFYKKKIPIIMVIAFIQVLLVMIVSGDAFSFFNRYPMKKFAAQILGAKKDAEPVAVYRMRNNSVRLEVLTAHPVYDIHDPQTLRHFISVYDKNYVIMREADWWKEFVDDPLILHGRDKVWKAQNVNFKTVWKDGVRAIIPDYPEPVILLRSMPSGNFAEP